MNSVISRLACGVGKSLRMVETYGCILGCPGHGVIQV